MKKQFIYVMAAVCCSMLISCHSSKARVTVSEDEVEYLTEVVNMSKWGERGIEFFQIVPGSYDVVSKGGTLSMTIPLKIVEGKKYPNYKAEEFNLFVTNVEEKYIKINDEKVRFNAIDKDAAYKELCNATIGEVVNVTFEYTSDNSDDISMILGSITSCEIELLIDEP